MAVGNWRVIGHDTARLLAHHGAALVHSAPSVGVRDWSDLRIAVSAGVWLAGARPGDVIEIVSDDQAFDAVGDVAASLGVTFRRTSYRALAGGRSAPQVEAPSSERQAASLAARRTARLRRAPRAGAAAHARRAAGVAGAAHGAARRDHRPGARAARERAGRRQPRCAGQRAARARLQPPAGLAAPDHSPAADQGARPRTQRDDQTGRQRRRAGRARRRSPRAGSGRRGARREQRGRRRRIGRSARRRDGGADATRGRTPPAPAPRRSPPSRAPRRRRPRPRKRHPRAPDRPGGAAHAIPRRSLPSGEIICGFHGGSQTMSTVASPTPGSASSL